MTQITAAKASRVELEHTMRDLNDLGLGWPGTPGEHARQEYLVKRFESLGFEVEREPFPFLAYPQDAQATCVSSVLGEISAHPVQYTACAQAHGLLVYIGQARAKDLTALDLAGVGIEGKICMARTYVPFTITAELARRGAAGLVVHAETHDDLIPHFTGRGFPPPLHPPWTGAFTDMPAVTVAKGSGDELLTAHASGSGTVSIEHRVDYFEATSENIVAKLKGKTDQFVVLAAHYDTQRAGGPSDNDNGLAAILELARIFRGRQPRLGIHFLALACEESIMWGSHSYAQRHIEELQLCCRAMMNWDSPCSVYEMTRACWGSPELKPIAEAAANATGWGLQMWQDATEYWADEASFRHIGIPTIWLWEHPPVHPYYHSTGDTLDRISFDKLRNITETGAWVVEALTGDVAI